MFRSLPNLFICHGKEALSQVVLSLLPVNNLKSKFVNWFRNKDLLNHDVSRGGVSIKTDMTMDHAKSILNIAMVKRNDGGTYLCSTPPLNASITVHVLNNGK